MNYDDYLAHALAVHQQATEPDHPQHIRPMTREELAAFNDPQIANSLMEMGIMIDEAPEHQLTEKQLAAIDKECYLLEAIEDAEENGNTVEAARLKRLYDFLFK